MNRLGAQSNPAQSSPVVPVVLCGGASRRLWPLTMPKQFLHLNGEFSMLQQTVKRLKQFPNVAAFVFSCNQDYEQPLRAQLETIGYASSDYDFIAEPFPRNTGPAFLMSALHAQQQYGDKAVLMFLPSDHMIDDDAAYVEALQKAVVLAKQGTIATIGLKPTTPHTGFGYIRRGEPITTPEQGVSGYKIASFHEKPSREDAQSFIASLQFYWNSGIYVLTVKTLLENATWHCPKMLEQAQYAFLASKYREHDLWVDAEAYQTCDDIPFDKAISEKTTHGTVCEAQFNWQDMGSWSTMADMNTKDAFGNVISGNIIAQGVRDCYIHTSSNKPVIALGIEDLVLVDTPNGLLITRKDMDQQVKAMMEQFQLMSEQDKPL